MADTVDSNHPLVRAVFIFSLFYYDLFTTTLLLMHLCGGVGHSSTNELPL